MTQASNFEPMGRGYQEKVLQLILTDRSFADQMTEVLEPSHFTFVHLEAISKAFFGYRAKYKEFPSLDLIPNLLRHDERMKADTLTQSMAAEYLRRVVEVPLNGDAGWVRDTSLEFCKRQTVLAAMLKGIDDIENLDYGGLKRSLSEALTRGEPKTQGHEYGEDFEARMLKSEEPRIGTGWSALDKALNGGWKRKMLGTFIAATGTGKTMYLVNAACALVAQGLSVLYVTLEMDEIDIGLRCDSWFSEVPIDNVTANQEHVRACMLRDAKGRLMIKKWPTKRATVDHIRNHVEYLRATKNFVPDAVIVDYADLMKPMGRYGEKRHELEANYEELRAMSDELNAIVLTADQTNREGLEIDLVTIAQIGEAYAKATVCDLIMTITRTQEMKADGRGRLYNAKSRLGKDGQVFDFLLDTSKNVRVTMLEQGVDVVEHLMSDNKTRADYTRARMRDLMQQGAKVKETVQ